MDKNNNPALTIIGDVGIDVVLGPIDRWPAVGTETLMDRSELRAGGSAGNTAFAASYLGAACRLLSLVGDDSLGAWLTEQFQPLRPSLPKCDRSTSVSIGIVHVCGERTFFTTRGHLEAFGFEHVRPFLSRAHGRNAIALLAGVFLTPRIRRQYAQLIDEIAALGYTVALDTGWPSGNWDEALREEMFSWVGKCDHVLLNEMELACLGNDANFRSALAQVGAKLKPGASLIIKRGGHGALGFQDGRTVAVDAVAVKVFDTIGAGDSFNAGYLLARSHCANMSAALDAGRRAAASIIGRFPRRSLKTGELAEQLQRSASMLYTQAVQST